MDQPGRNLEQPSSIPDVRATATSESRVRLPFSTSEGKIILYSQAELEGKGFVDPRYDTAVVRDRTSLSHRITEGDNSSYKKPKRSNLGTQQQPPAYLGKRPRENDPVSDLERSKHRPHQNGGRKRRALDALVKNSVALDYGAEDAFEVDEADLVKYLGFTNFKSTKNTKVPGNEYNYGVSKTKTSQYRQYMNRVGGFNRPLSPTRGNKFAKPAATED